VATSWYPAWRSSPTLVMAYLDLDHMRSRRIAQSLDREIDADGGHRFAPVGEHGLLALRMLDDLDRRDRTATDDDNLVLRWFLRSNERLDRLTGRRHVVRRSA
jgi:hypothetical protein